ncbi:sulfatase-like hydrolase/transferase [Salinarchaeum laminariae]|uniref:sulfatase-like hydrolase/transferase n=1 Tax=Salinarchaeum laminariae TaxID=869888 RepID=UPI0020BF0901|nr:sulfatase-like hydrolase/transferase [Salinarchaeum laminariae]
MSDRPNVLFLMDDEHRSDVLGYAGDDVVRTPTLDRLAETGVVFENAYTPAPRCMPARQCLMTGQLPRTSGCESYGDDLDPQSMTFARRFAQYGYDTVAAGKLHHTGEDKAQGWTQLIGRSGGCNVERVEEATADGPEPKRVKWSDAREVRRAGVGHPDAGWKSRIDEYRTRGACDFLVDRFLDPHYDREQHDRPLMLKVSLTQPHYPYLTTQEKFEYYLDRVDPYVDEEAFDHDGLSRRRVHVRDDDERRVDDRPGAVSPRDVRRATAAYYGMIETVDECFGRVLDALERVGEDLSEWIVVYTSDHGEMLGQHGIWEKGHHFEASAGVPLVIRWPERFEPGTVEQNVSLCDLFATLCDLADVPLPADHTLDSRSLVPLLEGDSERWNDEVVSAEDQRCMIKRGGLKYLHFPDDPAVLFDLDADPGETTNVVDDPEYSDAVERFRARRAELGYGSDAVADYEDAGYEPGVPTAN